MAYLEIADIINSITVPALIKDEFIRRGTFEFNPSGRIRMYSGGFTTVFPCNVNGEKWAFRCWHKDLGNVRRRFKGLQLALQSIAVPFLAEFKYVDEGIVVNGKIYPTTRMKWIDGLNIKDYIYHFRNEPDTLNKLADSFLKMCKSMHENQLSHGDLQHGNIIVDKNGNLVLIDYDSLYHPSMGDMGDIITGLKDYQHPQRKNNTKASEKLDYFSELIIYLCIKAIAEDPTLADKYNLNNSESMLFTAEDYTDIEKSILFKNLLERGGYIKILCEILKEYLSHNTIDELQPMEQMLDLMLGTPEIISFDVNKPGVYSDEQIILKWEAKNVLNQRINAKELSPALRSYKTKVDKNTSRFTLTVDNVINSISKSVEAKIYPLVEIKLEADNKLIRKGKRNRVNIKWDVQNAYTVAVTDKSGKVLATSFSGLKTIVLEDTETIVIVAIGLDGKRQFRKEFSIESANECDIHFSADKRFSLPGVPIVLSWNVNHAKTVELEGKFPGTGIVAARGKLIIEPTCDTIAILKVKDAFGTRKEEIQIRMLPLPRVIGKFNHPNVANKVEVNVNLVRPKVKVSLPEYPQIRSIPFVPILNVPNFRKVRFVPLIEGYHEDYDSLVKMVKLKPFKFWSIWYDMIDYFKNKFNKSEN